MPEKPSPALAACRREAVRLLKRYGRASEEERTPLLRSIAETLVEARSHFSRADGSPDWKGRTYPYRVWVRDVFTDAGIPREQQPTIQSAVRYHVGAVLRDRLDDETLADYGLIPRSPRERSADRRAGRSALLKALTSRDLAGGSLVALTAASTVLSKIDPADLDDLDGDALAVVEATLADLERLVKRLRRRVATAMPPA